MEGNDIISYAPIGQGLVFEGLLASPPTGVKSLIESYRKNRNNWDSVLAMWEPHDMPLRSLADTVNRLGIGANIYTFLADEAAPAIETWLRRKGIDCPVYFYETPQLLEYDLRFNREVRFIYVADEEVAKVLGIRATVTSPERAWTL